jgi:hypothetical protein
MGNWFIQSTMQTGYSLNLPQTGKPYDICSVMTTHRLLNHIRMTLTEGHHA